MVVNGWVYPYFKNLNRWSEKQESILLCLNSQIPIAATSGKTHSARSSAKPSAYNTRQAPTITSSFERTRVTLLRMPRAIREKGVLLRVYNFTALSVTGLLISGTGDEQGSEGSNKDLF